MQIRCRCGQRLTVDASAMGRGARCPSCGLALRVPAATGTGLPLGRISLVVAGAGMGLILLMLAGGATWTTLLLTTLCLLLALQGLWLGAIRMMVLLGAMAVGLAIAIPVGGALGGPVRSVFGVPRLLSGLVGSVLVAALLVIAAVAAAGPLARRILGKGRLGGHLDRWLGLSVGAAEGLLLSLTICWGLVVLQPLARAARRQAEAHGQRHPVAEVVDGLAQDAGRSLFGRAAAAANPLQGAAPVRVVTEFGQVASDEAALRALAEDPQMKAIAEEPQVKAAIERARGDQELMRLLRRRDLRALLDNETVLSLATDPGLRRILLEKQEVILQAIERARRAAGERD